MSLGQALATAVAGLRTTQAGMSIIASNVANAETAGYVRKTPVQITTAAGDLGVSVRVAAINRELDQFVQRQLRVEISGAAYADLRASMYAQLQQVYGVPGSDSALETVFNKLTTALQALATSPESASARSAVLSAAQVVTQQLNSMSNDIQALRADAEFGLADAVARANEAMRQIASINQQLGSSSRVDGATATLLDQRDHYIDQLAELMDVRVIETDNNQVTIFTNAGLQLVGLEASQLAFDARGTITPTSQWSTDPAERGVGTLTLVSPTGGSMDLIASGSIRSGQIAAYLEMRDEVLVQAQSQLDAIAAALASALSDRTVAGTAVTAGPQTGFDVDTASLLAGNTINLTYTDTATGTQRQVTIMRVDDPTALPLQDTVTADPNDRVIGVNFSGGMSSIVAQLNAALGSTGLQFSNPAGTTLRVLDDGAGNQVDVDALSTTATVTTLTGGSAEIPFFLDAGSPYTGAITGQGSQSVGLAGRIAVNASLIADPAKLVVYQAATAAGDTTRPTFLYDRLVNASLDYPPQTGIGSKSAPFTGSISAYMRQMIAFQGEAADAAANLDAGQEVVLNALRERFSESAGVNIDREMANLLNLQNAYAANARVMSTVKEMFDALMRI